MWKWLLGIFVVSVVVCGVGGFVAWRTPSVRDKFKSFLPQQQLTVVRIEAADRGTLTRTVSAPGQIEPRTNVKLSAQVSARILALPFRENQRVKKGDVVVRLDARDLQAQVDASRASMRAEEARLEGAQATLERARREQARVRTLAGSGDVAASALEEMESEFLRAQSSLSAAERAVDIAKAQIIRAEKDLENTVISSPMDGTITSLNAEVGELVVIGTLNNAASVIMEIADLSVMLLKARVDESNILPVKEGQGARVYVNAYGERVFKGTVERVELQRKVDRENNGYFETEVPVMLEKGEILRSGLTANAEIEVETLADVLLVPTQAVVDRKIDDLPRVVTEGSPFIKPGSTFARIVFLVEKVSEAGKTEGATGATVKPTQLGGGGGGAGGPPKQRTTGVTYKVIAVPVETGTSDLTRTVILGGLKPGDRVVSGPFKVLTTLKHEQMVTEEAGPEKPGEKSGEKTAEPAQAGADGKAKTGEGAGAGGKGS